MSLQIAVATPFKHQGRDRVDAREFVVALSFDRDWCSPDQAERLIDIAAGEGLLRQDGEDLIATFDLDAVTIPDDFTPAESLFTRRSPFESVLAELVDAGHEKQESVAAINDLQQRLGISAAAAAVVYARRYGLNVRGAAERVRDDIDG